MPGILGDVTSGIQTLKSFYQSNSAYTNGMRSLSLCDRISKQVLKSSLTRWEHVAALGRLELHLWCVVILARRCHAQSEVCEENLNS